MRTAIVLGVAALGLGASLAHAADPAPLSLKTTEDLYRVCTTPASDPQARESLDLCEGFLLGAVSYHDAITDRQNLKRLICYPQSATRDQGIAAFTAWAASHQTDQKYMSEPAVYGVVRGLASKWPCNQAAQGGTQR